VLIDFIKITPAKEYLKIKLMLSMITVKKLFFYEQKN